MDDQLQRALDSETDLEALDPAMRQRVLEARRLFDAVVESVPVDPIPDLGPAVLDRIRAVSSPAHSTGVLDWLWRPRAIAFTWRPLHLVAACALVVAAVVALRATRDGMPVAGPGQVLAEFRLDAPEAHSVALAGGFTEWQPSVALTRNAAGIWTVVIPLDPGVHQYAFVVDDERWMADPSAPAYDDGFGGQNSRVALLAADEVRQ